MEILFLLLLVVCFFLTGPFDTELMVLPVLFVVIICLSTVVFHTSNLSTLRAQKYVIESEQENVKELEDRLKNLTGSTKIPTSLMNGDTPVKSLVESITKAQTRLSKSRTEMAEAKKSIVARKMMFPLIVSYFGEE